MLSGPKDLDNLKRLGALKIPESETGDKDWNSEDDEREGKISGDGLL
jgi:hypothetical protein